MVSETEKKQMDRYRQAQDLVPTESAFVRSCIRKFLREEALTKQTQTQTKAQ